MFDYVSVKQDYLSKEELDKYQAYYCGLCKKLKENCGSKGKMLLNYGMTFVIILLSSIYTPIEVEQLGICGLHFTRKRKHLTNCISDYVACMSIMLSYYSVVDEWKDEHNPVKNRISALLRKEYEDMAAKYPRQANAISEYNEKMKTYEQNEEVNIELVSGTIGELFGEIIAWKEDCYYEELKNFGFYLGKFVYLVESYEEFETDERKNKYNPLRIFKDENKDDFEILFMLMLKSLMFECEKSLKRFPIVTNKKLIDDILESGVWFKYEEIQNKKKRKDRNLKRA